MKTVFKIVFKVTIISAFFITTWLGLSEIFRIDKDFSGDQFRKLPKESIDILFLGSSHAQYSMNPAVIYNETGYYSYVLGSGCQPMAMSYKFLEEALKTQKPEVVVLEVFTMMPAQEVCYADGMFYRAIQQMSGINKYEAAALVDNDEVKYDYMFDLRMNHSNWKRNDFPVKKERVTTFSPSFGYIYKDPTDFEYAYLIPLEKEKDYELREKDLDMLNSIIETCKENNIELILTKTPIVIDQTNQDALETIWEYADSKGINYIDYIELAEEIDFAIGINGDTWHNNTWGAEKTSRYLAKYIEENNLIKNHKTDNSLETVYKQAELETMGHLSVNQINIYQLLEYAETYDCMIAFKYEGKRNTTLGDYENELLQSVGLDHDFIKDKSKDYYAIIKNKEIIVESDSEIQRKIDGVRYEILNDKIIIDDYEIDNLGELEIVVFDEKLSWFQPIDIDYASRFFWKNGCNGWDCE